MAAANPERSLPTGVAEAFRNPNTAAELQRLGSRFPGMQNDERMVNLFEQVETGLVKIIGLDGSYDPDHYDLGGFRGYSVIARLSDRSSWPQDRPVVGPFFEAGEIWTL